jgi:hypothetical protein
MENPGADHLLETVRKINEIGRRARSGEPQVEDYLRMVSADPVTGWFTDLLREKRNELEGEKDRADRLARVLRAWHREAHSRIEEGSASETELRLANILRAMEIIEPEEPLQ